MREPDAPIEIQAATMKFIVRMRKPAEIAKARLRSVIAADRAACEDGRWVELPKAISLGLAGTFLTPYAFRAKTHYRWEPRR